jgi:Polyketide cyclase / dehydrase and lipid transport
MKRIRTRLLLFAGFLLIFPFFLRRRPRVERRITILAPPSVVFPLLNELREWPLWTEWNRRERIAYAYGEQSAGEGAVQRWRGERMSGELRIVRSEPNERIDYELSLSDFAQVFGRIHLHEDGACTRVVWRCVWERAENPYRRYLDLLARYLIGRDFQAGLERLKRTVETQ